jgi:hypothetical protein
MKLSGTKRHIFSFILMAGLIISSLSMYSFAGETIIGIPDNFPEDHVSDLANYEVFKIDSSGIPSGISYPDGTVTKTNGVLSVTLSAIQYKDGKDVIGFSWSSNIPVSYVFVKGGPIGLLYQYDPATTGAGSLFTPLNPNNGKNYGLSHISFYYSEPEEEEPGDEEPGDEEPGDEEPGDEEPGDEEPGDEEPGDEEPGDEEPGDEEPGDEEPGDEEPGDEEPGDEEPGDEEPGDEEPGDEEPGDEEPGDEEPGDEEPGDEEPGDEEPGDEEPGDEEPGDEEPGDEEPGDEEPGDEEPGDEEPGDEEPETNISSEQEIPEEPIPVGIPTDVEQEPVAIEDEQIPEGLTALPQTSGIPAGILYGLGGLLAAAGMYIRKKSR